jgi:hypothetical protein
MLAIDWPRLGDSDQSTGHVNQSPAAESPEHQRGEPDAAIGKPDDTAENQHDHDVENELGVVRSGNIRGASSLGSRHGIHLDPDFELHISRAKRQRETLPVRLPGTTRFRWQFTGYCCNAMQRLTASIHCQTVCFMPTGIVLGDAS